MVVQRFRIGASRDGDFTAVGVHTERKHRAVFVRRHGVRGGRAIKDDLGAAGARNPSVVVEVEVVAAVCHASVRDGGEFIVVVHQVDVLAQICGERPVQRHKPAKLVQRVGGHGLDDNLRFPGAAHRDEGTRAVVVGGVRVVVQRLRVGASVNRLVGAIAVPHDPRVPALGLTRVVEGHVIAHKGVVRAHRVVDLRTFARVEAVPVVDVRVGVVVHGLAVHASVHRDEELAVFRVDPNGVSGLKLPLGEGVRGGLVAQGDVHAGQPRLPSVVVHEEVVAAVGQTSVGVGGFPLAVVVHQIHVHTRRVGQGPVHGVVEPEVDQRVVAVDFNRHGGLVVATCRNGDARSVVGRGVGVVVHRSLVGASVNRLVGAVAFPHDVRLGTRRFARVVEGHVLPGEVVVAAHRVVDVVALTLVRTRTVIHSGVGVVVEGIGVGASLGLHNLGLALEAK